MPLIPAQCPNCGGVLSVDQNGKADICSYCGTPFIVQDAIQNFNTTYNITNNVYADKVIMEQVDPGYQDALQRIRAEVNNIITHGNKAPDFTRESVVFGQDAKKYFDKPEFQYNYALLLFYNRIHNAASDRSVWQEPLKKAIELTADPSRKEYLLTEYNRLKEELNHENQKKNTYMEEFLDKLNNHPELLDGIPVNASEGDYSRKGVFTSYEGKAYLIPINNMNVRPLIPVTCVEEILRSILEEPWKIDKEAKADFQDSSIIKFGNYSMRIGEDIFKSDSEFHIRMIVRDAVSMTPRLFNSFDRYRSYDKKYFTTIIRFALWVCPVCGGPMKQKGLFGRNVCESCGHKVSDSFRYPF